MCGATRRVCHPVTVLRHRECTEHSTERIPSRLAGRNLIASGGWGAPSETLSDLREGLETTAQALLLHLKVSEPEKNLLSLQTANFRRPRSKTRGFRGATWGQQKR